MGPVSAVAFALSNVRTVYCTMERCVLLPMAKVRKWNYIEPNFDINSLVCMYTFMITSAFIYKGTY